MGSADPPPGKMDDELKSEYMQKSSFLTGGEGRCREQRYADHIFIQIYSRMHHFIVKFSKISLPQAARGIDPLNQNPADALGHTAEYLLKRSSCSTTLCI